MAFERIITSPAHQTVRNQSVIALDHITPDLIGFVQLLGLFHTQTHTPMCININISYLSSRLLSCSPAKNNDHLYIYDVESLNLYWHSTRSLADGSRQPKSTAYEIVAYFPFRWPSACRSTQFGFASPNSDKQIVNASEKNSRNDYRSMSEDRGNGNKDVKGLRTDVTGVSTQWAERGEPREKKFVIF